MPLAIYDLFYALSLHCVEDRRIHFTDGRINYLILSRNLFNVTLTVYLLSALLTIMSQLSATMFLFM